MTEAPKHLGDLIAENEALIAERDLLHFQKQTLSGQLTDGAVLNDALRAERNSLRSLCQTMAGALKEIRDLKERPFDKWPEDWHEQIEACPDCQRYKNHPIQNGICDTHRRPIWAREKHDAHETSALGYRAMAVARDALSAAKAVGIET